MGELTRARFVWVVGICALTAGTSRQALAQSSDGTRPVHPVEVTSFVSMGSEMSSNIGAAVAFAWTEALSGEVEVGYREGALSTSLNVLYHLPAWKRLEPYVAAGAGLEQRQTPLVLPDGGVVAQTRLAFVVNAGGGVKVPVTDAVGYRADARWSNAVGMQPEAWRLYNGMTLGVGGGR